VPTSEAEAEPEPGSPAEAEPEPESACTQPVVLVRHHRHGPFRVTGERARAWVADPPSGVRVLPAHDVTPRLRVAVVDGVHPLRRPAAYPLQEPVPDGVDCPPRRGVTLTVVGDVMLGRGVAAAADRPGAQLAATAPRLRRADVTVGNLESTLSRAGAPTQGGDSFAADPAVAGSLRRAGFDVLSLANNHAGDFGPVALRQTARRLRAAGLDTFGAGRDLAQARRPVVTTVRGSTYGFLGFNAIGETPYAGPGRTGANSVSMPPRTGPLDRRELRRFLADVRALDRRVDAVVVLPHWGTQYTNVPEPVQRYVARRLVAAGADLVVGGHPHWVQGMSTVGDAVVAHSLGNFVFDMDFMAETMVGVALETTWWGGRLVAVEPAPYRMDATFTPRWVPWDRAGDVLRLLGETSGPAFRVGR
jgi:poly-gamma-glutamate synthesis protein (capsule biosynthesis protein)